MTRPAPPTADRPADLPASAAARAVVPLLAALVAGCALQLAQPALWPVAAYAGLAAAAALGLAILARRTKACTAPVVFALALALAFAQCGIRAAIFAGQALAPELEGRDLALTGVVAAMPQRNDSGLRFRFDVEGAAAGREAVAVPPRILLGWWGGAQLPDLVPGERWQFQVRLKAPHGNLNPHGFDHELWLWEQGLQATGYVRAGPEAPPPRRLAHTWLRPVERLRHAARAAILRQIEDRAAAGIVAALVVGDQAAIDRADWDVFRATGVAHLMSISGLHVTMFAWAAAFAIGWLWRRSARLPLAWPAQHAALAGGVALAAAYALFSGWGVPAQRTVWMLAAVALLRLAGRELPWPVTWLAACAVVVALDPWALAQPGFWLSFAAVGILFATNSGAARATPMRLAARFGQILREQWVVTVALSPLSLLMFGQVSVVGLAANLVAIPWVTLLVTPLAMAGLLVPACWSLAAAAVQALAWALRELALLPWASVALAQAPAWMGLAAVAGGLLLAMRLPWQLRALGVPLLLPALLWQAPRPAPGEFEVLAADVGQGNAVLVRTAGHALVYDAGPRWGETDAGHRVLVPLLRALGERVDLLVLSHRDSDHTGGAAAVLKMQPGAQLLASIEPEHELQVLRPARRCEAGQRWDWDGVAFEVLHPRPADYEAAGKANALSCVLRVSNGRAAALLAGDIEAAQESALVASGAHLRADWLLVPHHGSRTSSTEAFLDAVAPRLAIVQAGWRNRFGHPAPAVLQRYAARGVAVLDSPACGAATWRSGEPGHADCHRQVSRRYWHHRAAPAKAP